MNNSKKGFKHTLKSLQELEFFKGLGKEKNAKLNIKEKITDKLINSHTHDIVIAFHNAPDCDAIGSAAALYYALQSIGKNVTVISSRYSPVFSKIMKNINVTNHINRTYDLTILVDCSDRNRTIDYIDELSMQLIVIDHHVGSKPIGNLYLCEDKVSTTIIIYDLLKRMHINITKDIATAIYLGIYGDTNGFSNSNISPEVHSIAGLMLRKKADIEYINSIYRIKSVPMLKFMSDIYSKVMYDAKYRIIYTVLMIEDLEKYQVSYDIAEYIINELKSIEEANIAFLFIESKYDTKVKGRSKGKIYVNKILEFFGGGGHKYAGGALIDSVNIYNVVELVIARTKQYIDEL